jgi:hypothetical protein
MPAVLRDFITALQPRGLDVSRLSGAALMQFNGGTMTEMLQPDKTLASVGCQGRFAERDKVFFF